MGIRFARLGDVALLLPAFARLRAAYPAAHLALMTGTPYAPLARLCPWINEVIAVDRLALRDGPRLEAAREIVSLIRGIRSRRFDLTIDFHSFRETNLLTWLSGTTHRLGMKRADRAYLSFCFNLEPVTEEKSLHVSEMFRRVVDGVPGLPDCLPAAGPSVIVPSDVTSRLRARYLSEVPATAVVAVYAGASVKSRRWPPNRFAAIVDHVTTNWGAAVLILAGASEHEEEICRQIGGLVQDPQRISVVTGLGILELAGAIGLARLLVSNDTGPMHLGPALGVPTLGIFSESDPSHYSPTGEADRYVWRETIDAVTTQDVIDAMESIWGGREPVG
jgi:ADP-heptose:LPS heptosyltransferase